MKQLLAAASVALCAVTAASASSLPPGYDDNPSVVDAVAKAQSSGKPVIVYFTEHNCQVCGALDGWLVRGDIRQAYKDAYHFSMVFGDDMIPEERDRWRATYSPRGAPAWVVLAPDGGYLCTSSGGFANATAALDLHKLLTRALTARSTQPATRVAAGPPRPRLCTERGLGLTPAST